MVYAKFGGQTECIMGNWKIENYRKKVLTDHENLLCINFAAIKIMFVVFLDKRCLKNLLTSLKERY